MNKSLNSRINLIKLDKNLKSLLFYNCNQNIKTELATLYFDKEQRTILSNQINYKKKKLFTKSTKLLERLKNTKLNLKILMNISLWK